MLVIFPRYRARPKAQYPDPGDMLPVPRTRQLLHAPSAATHPGVYAMGDAGRSPLLDDRAARRARGRPDDVALTFVDRIRERQPLEQVFRDYGVNYYYTTMLLDCKETFQRLSSVRRAQPRASCPSRSIYVDDHLQRSCRDDRIPTTAIACRSTESIPRPARSASHRSARWWRVQSRNPLGLSTWVT